MRVIDFVVTGQSIERDPRGDFAGIVSGSAGYLVARFRFSADWNGCKKVAVFTSWGKDYPTPIIDGVCEIPAEALVGNTVEVSVVGQRDRYRITTDTTAFAQKTGR